MHYRISFIFVTFISLFCFALPGVAQDANTDEYEGNTIMHLCYN